MMRDNGLARQLVMAPPGLVSEIAAGLKSKLSRLLFGKSASNGTVERRRGDAMYGMAPNMDNKGLSAQPFAGARRSLRAGLSAVPATSSEGRGGSRTGGENRARATRILIAESDKTARRLLRSTLQREGYEVVEANNGRSALELLCDAGGPRLALLDWLMPEVSGVEICREIRRQTDLPYVYIILLGGLLARFRARKTSKRNIVSGLEAGADDYLINCRGIPKS